MPDEKTAESSLNAPGRYKLNEIFLTLGGAATAGYKCGFGHVRSWQVPPNWSSIDWHDEIRALAIMSVWQAMQDYDPHRGVPLNSFICCRIKAQVLTHYRREWRFALRIKSSDTENFDRLAGAVPDGCPVQAEFEFLDRALCQLPKREYWLLNQLFWKERTETSIAAELHISQQAVSKRKQSVLRNLRFQL